MEMMKSAWPKRVLRHCRARIHQKKNMTNIRSNVIMVEAIARANGGHDHHHEGFNVSQSTTTMTTQENGVVRMKILVRKQDVKQVLELMNPKLDAKYEASSSTVEQRINLLRKKQLIRANLARQSCRQSTSWSPALQSIPE